MHSLICLTRRRTTTSWRCLTAKVAEQWLENCILLLASRGLAQIILVIRFNLLILVFTSLLAYLLHVFQQSSDYFAKVRVHVDSSHGKIWFGLKLPNSDLLALITDVLAAASYPGALEVSATHLDVATFFSALTAIFALTGVSCLGWVLCHTLTSLKVILRVSDFGGWNWIFDKVIWDLA